VVWQTSAQKSAEKSTEKLNRAAQLRRQSSTLAAKLNSGGKLSTLCRIIALGQCSGGAIDKLVS